MPAKSTLGPSVKDDHLYGTLRAAELDVEGRRSMLRSGLIDALRDH